MDFILPESTVEDLIEANNKSNLVVDISYIDYRIVGEKNADYDI